MQMTIAAAGRCSMPGDTRRNTDSRRGSVTTTSGCKRRLPALGANDAASSTASSWSEVTGCAVSARATRRLRMTRRTSVLGSVMSLVLTQPHALHGMVSHGHAGRVELRRELAPIVVLAERHWTQFLQRPGHQVTKWLR